MDEVVSVLASSPTDRRIYVALERNRQRDELALTPGDLLERRYVEGQRLYRERHRPFDRATWVVVG